MFLSTDILEAIFEKCKNILPYFFVILLLTEAVVLIIKAKPYFNKETKVNFLTGAVTFFVQALLKSIFLVNIYPFVYQHRLITIDNIGWSFILAFFLYTFIQFFTHYIYHRVRIFWCIHEVHHSAIDVNITTGIRTSIFDIVSLELFFLSIPFLGIHPVFYFLFFMINKFWGTIIHISEHLIKHHTILNKLVVTPTVHHIHHASNGSYKDKNFGELVPWFDIMFGTFSTYNNPLVYGTTKITEPIDFWYAQTHEFKALFMDIKKANSLKTKIKFLFMPPGWQPAETIKRIAVV